MTPKHLTKRKFEGLLARFLRPTGQPREGDQPELMAKMVDRILIAPAEVVEWGIELAKMCCPSKYGHEWTCTAFR